MQAREGAAEEEEESKKKWICEYCTYSNWQSSMKCTMCRGKKPALLCSTENIYSAANTNSLRGESSVLSPQSSVLSTPTQSGSGTKLWNK